MITKRQIEHFAKYDMLELKTYNQDQSIDESFKNIFRLWSKIPSDRVTKKDLKFIANEVMVRKTHHYKTYTQSLFPDIEENNNRDEQYYPIIP